MPSPQTYQSRKAAGLCVSCGERPPSTAVLCTLCNRDRHDRHHSIISEIYAAYGNACKCCGETNRLFLTIDHVNGDGARQRIEATGHRYGTAAFLRKVAKKAKETGIWPDDLQCLCFNCNCGRQRNGGICPHAAS